MRADLCHDDVADVVCSTNSAEFHALLVGERGWTTERFAQFLADDWARVLPA